MSARPLGPPPAQRPAEAGVGPTSSRPGPRDPTMRRVPKSKTMQTLRGIAVSPGVAIGPALVIDPSGRHLPPRAIDPAAVAAELDRLDTGLEAARIEAEVVEADARRRLGPQYADILAAHARMIADPVLRDDARRRIERDRIAAEHAVCEVLDGYAARLERLADAYLAARAADVRDIQQRILDQLAGRRVSQTPDGPGTPSVVLAHDLSPSQTAGLDPGRVLGFATEAGGRTSHTAIVAAGLEIPAVLGLGRFLDRARACRTVIVDGDEGLVVLDPDAATLKRYRRASVERAARFAVLADLAGLPAETRDGTRIELLSNIEFPGEVAASLERGADGIGLYRTEFLYLGAPRPPTEAEQLAAYEAVIRSIPGRPVTIRTLDLGADKLVSFQREHGAPRNPFLGLRSIRLSLRDPTLFRPQLRAILRASALGDVRIMFPLVSTLAEFRRARALVDEVAAELVAEGVPVRADLPVGAMIEVPAAAVMADQLAKEVDFFSIGTNDLIQYTLAVDRTDETVADLYSAADPAVLRLIAMVVDAAGAHRTPVTVCGSMGGEPLYTMLLLGLGVRCLSMPPHQLPEVKRVIRAIRLSEARDVAVAALRCDNAEAIVALLGEAMRRVLPDVPIAPPDDRAG
jgi:phosphotransferase system enzyme I (PtsI)